LLNLGGGGGVVKLSKLQTQAAVAAVVGSQNLGGGGGDLRT